MFTTNEIKITGEMISTLKTRYENISLEAEGLSLLYKKALTSFNQDRVISLFSDRYYITYPKEWVISRWATDGTIKMTEEKIKVVGDCSMNTEDAGLLYTIKNKSGKWGKTKYILKLDEAIDSLTVVI